MFGSKATPVEAPTIIGEGAVIEGTVRAEGRVQVDGEIQGTLEVKGQVSIGPKGKVEGELIADDVAVGGRAEGKVTARKHLHVVSSGVVRGDVRYETLQVDRGAVLDGRTAHGEQDADAATAASEANEKDGAGESSKAAGANKANGARPAPPPSPNLGKSTDKAASMGR